jgi:DNA-directed RNA polymerase subunit RPC12/RpoP
MTTFICSQCNYRFDAETEKIPKRCPYCGKANCVRKEKSAEDLVDEVSRVLDEAE